MTAKLLGFRSAMIAALSSVPDRRDIEAADWWSRFVREMEALGCVNIRQNPSSGEFEFDCPAESVKAARAIVARYSVK